MKKKEEKYYCFDFEIHKVNVIKKRNNKPIVHSIGEFIDKGAVFGNKKFIKKELKRIIKENLK